MNGVRAVLRDGRFEARVPVPKAENRIEVKAGGETAAIRVFRDFRREKWYRFSIDDNIYFLKDLAENQGRYTSLFDNPYLAFWREMHRKYGTKFYFNIYYETEGFNLSQMPVKYRAEWQANADWIRLCFHARANDPDRPYIQAPASEVMADYRLVMGEIERFAGKELASTVMTVHWGEATRETCVALRKAGIRTLAGYFEFGKTGKPQVSYYLAGDAVRHFAGRDYWRDTATDLTFVKLHTVLNQVPVDKVVPVLEKIAAGPGHVGLMEPMIHEQYFYPFYKNYLPDYRERVERAIRWLQEHGYRSVFYGEQFPANSAMRLQGAQ